MPKATLKIKGYVQGRETIISKRINLPVFSPAKRNLGEIEFSVGTEAQEREWLDERYDELVAEYYRAGHLDLILDAEIVKPKPRRTKPDKISEIKAIVASLLSGNIQLIADFTAVLQSMWDSVKDLPAATVVRIVMAAQGIGYDSATNALNHLSQFKESLEKKRLPG